MNVIRAVFSILTQRERKNIYVLFIAVVGMAALEVVSVASIMPFLSVASNPESVQDNPILRWIFTRGGFSNTKNFLVALGVGAFLALVISNVFIVCTMWALYRYVWGRNHSLSRRLLSHYLNRTYEYFLNKNSAELGKNVLQEVREVTGNMLFPALRGSAKGVVSIFIVCFLFYINPVVATIAALVLGSAYASIYLAVRKWLDRIGTERVETNTDRYQIVNEAFGAIKQVKVRGKERSFIRQFERPSKEYSRAQTHYQVLKSIPKYVLEAVAFGGIILIAVYLIIAQENVQSVIPTLGVYAFAGYRLMPALQAAFRGIASARFNIAALNEISEELQTQPRLPYVSNGSLDFDSSNDGIKVTDKINIDDVSYAYPNSEKKAVKNLSIDIPAESTIGFVGKTGSGKTTVVDIVLGLLKPQSGNVCVDGSKIHKENLSRWQQSIGYVPQQIYLSDDTIARNIAFGVPRNDINYEAVRDVAQRARIRHFVENELPNQWDTVVGERGVKLSGGQRQRIGIARALYHNPSTLIFDEATSALDQSTESNVMEAIYNLRSDHTILMIAHRLSTVKRANKIVMLEDGLKVSEGDYKDLKRRSEKFRSMALS